MTSSLRFALGLLFVGIVAGATGAGCELVAKPDRNKIGNNTGGSGAGGNGSGGTTPTCDEATCDAMNTECTEFNCADDGTTSCDLGTAVNEGQPCTLENMDAGECSGGACVDINCTNGTQDGDETGLDCGGICNVSPTGKCDNTIGCNVPADCKSNICTNNVCEPCTAGTDCEDPTTQYCNVDNGAAAAICENRKTTGSTCGSSGDDDECATNFCVDGFCCNAACDAPDCESCRGADTGQGDGMCAPVQSGLDPDGDCTQNISADPTNGCESDVCAGTSTACAPANGIDCRPASGACDLAESCDGTSLGCPATDAVEGMGVTCGTAPTQPCDAVDTCDGMNKTCTDELQTAGTSVAMCSPYVCNGNDATCPAECFSTADCEPSHYCLATMNPNDMEQCEPRFAAGETCTLNEECLSNVCNAMMECDP